LKAFEQIYHLLGLAAFRAAAFFPMAKETLSFLAQKLKKESASGCSP
jgi:hypothetical protein